MRKLKMVATLLIVCLIPLVSESPRPAATPSPASSPVKAGEGRWITDEELQAFGEACVAEAAPDIVREATVELRVENAGLKAEKGVLEAQRDDALQTRDTALKEIKAQTIGGVIAAWVGAFLLVADFIFGWWRFGG